MTNITNLVFDCEISNDPMSSIGFGIRNFCRTILEKNFPELYAMFPIAGPTFVEVHSNDSMIVARIRSLGQGSITSFGSLAKESLDELLEKTGGQLNLEYETLESLGEKWYTPEIITYVGPVQNNKLSRAHVEDASIQWLERQAVPAILELNRRRIERAIPTPPRYDVKRALDEIWVLECDTELIQGTAFNLRGVGLVTCNHVLGVATHAFSPSSTSVRFRIKVIAASSDIDVAILALPPSLSTPGLAAGSADALELQDHIAVVGLPNYRLGDTGVFSPGLVTGYRTVSGVRRIMTNAPIIAGMSGGPVINGENSVIGIAVTGAERMEKAHLTEDHGVIPIDILKTLIKFNDV